MAQQNKSKLEAENQGLKEEIERLKALQSHPSFNQFLNQDHKTAWCLVDNELIVQSCSSSFQSLTGISPHTLIHSPFDLTSIIPPEKKPDYLHFILALKKHQHSPKILLDLKNATPLYIQAFNKKDQTLISFQKAASLDIKPDTPTKKNNPAATEDLQQLTEEYYAINKELKKTEKYLSLNQYSIEHSNNAIYWFGPTGRFHYVNQQACEMLEYTKEELLEKHAYDISNINPETWAQSWEKLRNAKRLTSEFLHITKSGKQIPVEISANYFIYEGQEYVFSVATDISERKKTEEKLIKSEKNYRSLFEQAVDGILMGDDKGVIIDANESICQMSGYNKAELKGNKINILFSEEELNNNPLRYDLLQEGREVKKERKLKAKKDHSDKIIEMNTKRLSDGRLQAFIRDVSEKKKAEETMMQASDIFNHIQTGLLIYQLKDLNDDRTLIMVNANPACEKLLGVHPDEMIGKTIDQNFPHLRAKGIPQRFAEVIRFQELYEVEDLTYEDERVLKKAFSFKGFPLPNQQIGVAFENISEKKIVEEAMAYQRSFEQLITQTSSQFIHIPYQKIDISIEASIGMLCRQMKASAGYLLNVDDQQEIMQMTHCWQNKELDINQELFQSIQKKDYPHLFETLLSGEVIAVETNHDINKQNKTITSLNFIPGNKTFLKIPIIHKQKLIAVLGFASIEENKKWKEVERDLLEMAGQIFINALQRKQSEEALFESERSYREIFNSPTDAIFILDAYKGDIIDLNKGALEMLGTDKKHAQNIFVQSHLKEGAYSIEQMKKFIIKTREVGDMRFEWFAEFNDTPTWSEVSLKYAQINGQERILAVARDITKRKNAEKKLEDTNNFLEGIVNTSYNVIYVRDIQRDKLIFVSKRIKDITQYTVEECLELDHVLSHFVHEEDYPTAENHVKNLMKTKADEQIESELRIRRKDKQIRWMHVTSTIFSRNEEGYPVHSMAVLTDITNRKKAEEALRISQQRLKLSLEATNDGLWDWYLDTGETYFSPQYYKMLGYKPGEFQADYDHWLQLVHPDDIPETEKAVKETIKRKRKNLKHEFRMKTKNGSWCWILARGGIVEYNEQNQPTRMAGTHTDISDRKKAEREIKQSQFLVEQIANTVPGFLYVRDIKTKKHLFVNQDIRKLLNYKQYKGDAQTDYLTGLMDQEDRKKYLKYLKTLSSKQSDEVSLIEYKLKDGEGEWRWYREWSTIFLRDEHETPLQILGIAQDITFAKTAEKALEENERKFHELFESSNDSIILIENETIIDCNKHTEEIFLLPKNEIIGRKLAELSPKMQPEGERSSKQFTHFLEIAHKKGNHTFEWISKRQNGELFYTDMRLNLVKLQEKTYIQAVLRDISNRKKSERALIESERKFRNIFNNSSDYIVIINLNNMHFAEVNDVFINASGYSRQELLNKNALDVLMPHYRNKSEERIKRIIKGGRVASEESEIITKKGKIIPVELNSKIIDYENDIALLTVARNIEERKQLQQKLFDTMIESEEKERQRIAGDLHDEIGPILSSLKMYILTLNSTNDLEKTEYVIAQVKSLIKQSITTVREISNDLSPHLLTNYGLDAAMQSTLEHTSEFTEINYQSNIGEQRFNPNIEIVYYRIIKELLNNTFKHASADHITIHLNLENNILKLYYADNGKGFDMDEQMKQKKEGIGIYSILNRIKSINGDYDFGGGKGKGFIFKLRTRIEPYHQHNPE